MLIGFRKIKGPKSRIAQLNYLYSKEVLHHFVWTCMKVLSRSVRKLDA